MSNIKSYISGVGHYLPNRVVTNEEMSQWIDTSDQWITERTGIKERRFADEMGRESRFSHRNCVRLGAPHCDYVGCCKTRWYRGGRIAAWYSLLESEFAKRIKEKK